MVKTENFIQVEIASATELRNWLAKNYAQQESIWLVTYKKNVSDKYVSTDEVLDELLCFGWIDGIKRKIDEQKVMQLISPRRAQHWAKTYKDRFAKLEKAGLVADAGKASVALSKKNGLWSFMDDVDALIKPADFVECLAQYPPALDKFENINKASRRFMLRYIKLAKTPQTRAKRILEITLLATIGEKLKGS